MTDPKVKLIPRVSSMLNISLPKISSVVKHIRTAESTELEKLQNNWYTRITCTFRLISPTGREPQVFHNFFYLLAIAVNFLA